MAPAVQAQPVLSLHKYIQLAVGEWSEFSCGGTRRIDQGARRYGWSIDLDPDMVIIMAIMGN